MAEGSGKSAKRSALKRGVLALAGSFGLGFGGGGAVTRAESGAPRGTTLTLFGRYWHLSAPHRVPGELPVRGDRMAMFGELLASQDGQKVGEFYAACFCVDSPFGSSPFAAANVEFHTFNLEDGTISGMGTASAGENVYAIVGGTGRYLGARGSYVALQRPHELGGDGTAEFRLTLVS